MRKFINYCLVIFTILSFGTSSSMTDPEYQKWLNSHKKQYQNFVDEYDKEFAQFLKDNWVETNVENEKARDDQPKPQDLPKTQEQPLNDPEPVKVTVKPIPPIPEKPSVDEPVIDKPIAPKEVKPNINPFDFSGDAPSKSFSWLGHDLSLPELNIVMLSVKTLNGDSIAKSWLNMAQTDFTPLSKTFGTIQKDLKLDDWGLAIFIHKYIRTYTQLDDTQAKLYTWFYLVKQGFESRVAFAENTLYLMLSVKQSLFGVKYFTLDDKPFYFVDLDNKKNIKVGKVYTYNKQHNSANKEIEIDLTQIPVQKAPAEVRRFEVQIIDEHISVDAIYSKAYIDFLDYYPQLEMKYYFQAEMHSQTKSTLLRQLGQALQGKTELESLNFLLRFVQIGLQYKTDQEQFNYENYLLTSETLHYPYADCEDRAVLYAYLVKNLLGNEVIGVQYDGHIATAVKVKSKIEGDTYQVNGQSYLVADPTYINANIGSVMPQYKNEPAQFIVF